jgi:uncharacterized RDD family membrane protein YckC
MKCPKCGYLGYERVERCRNCGYEFSLGSAAPTPELRLRDGDNTPRPLDDLNLVDEQMARRAAPPDRTPRTDADRIERADRSNPPAGSSGLAELPLFGAPITDDVPLITRPSPPRPPLSVRRASLEVPRVRSEQRPLLDWPVDPANMPVPVVQPLRAAQVEASPDASRPVYQEDAEPASLAARACAAAIDLALLAIVDLVVVYFTMKITGVTLAELAILPKAPLLVFLLVQNGGYLVAFTATGQTLGKLIAGVKVLADDSSAAPDVGRAVLRTIVWFVLAIPAGLGFLSAAYSSDGRGIHDRFAGTRVVRVGA